MIGPFFSSVREAKAKDDARICTLVVDAEENFNWLTPLHGTAFSTSCMRNIRDLHEILSWYGVVPAYLLTYPVLDDPDVVRILRRQQERGECLLGLQLHTWVTPPFEERIGHHLSFSGNLDPNLEERKLVVLKRRFIECFGYEPLVYRGGRYGLGDNTGALLEKHGFTVDTSLAPRTTFETEGGPDYTDVDYRLFWFGERRDLLEVPLCRSVVGWGGALASPLYRAVSVPWASRSRVQSLLTRSHCAERITLSPEGNDFYAMRRLVNGLHDRGQNILALSFHSSSLEIGGNPYVQSRADLHTFYDRLSAILDYLQTSLNFEFASIVDIPKFLVSPVLRELAA